MIALANNPAARGDASCAHTLKPPADSPNTVTLRASPPNAAALRCTHRSAACWSASPNAPDPATPG
ncbi:hypothetical protein BBK82_37030 [Lentzea guizhouensis]|uniref:Uncharacterized protein n=1 Tax=Lentzea guizhouensis TaxID=1586287 RepID=A0A1B2HSP7_9PSEU|nr:hypothetical protein BBK82_37030 [Lentzea guizhouensis]